MRWESYPKCKESGIKWQGKIPLHWNTKALKRIFRILNGSTPKSSEPEYWDGDIPWATPDDLGGMKGNRLDATQRMITTAGYESCGTSMAAEGSLILSTRAPIGHLAIAGRAICTNQGCRSLVFRNDDDTSYFYYQLLAIRPELESWGQGSTFKELGRSKLESIYLVSPPVKEQRAIAAFLDRETERIDTLIAKKERQIELLKEKRAALISHAVTRGLNPNAKMKNSGIEWLGEIPEHWGVVSLKSVLAPRGDAVKTGPFGSQLLSSEMLSGTIKVYNQRNVLDRNFQNGENYITDEKYADLKAFTIHPGDLLITTRGTIGHCALFPSDAELGILHPCLIRAQPDFRKIIPEYLAMLIQDSFLVKTQLAIMSNATTIDVIYSDSLKRVRLPVPPLLEQEKILSLVGCMVGVLNRLLEVVERSIDKLREYRMTLISAAVTGKIDVRKEVV